MDDSFEISVVINTTPKSLYEAWLDSEQHSAFTGSKAQVDPQVGGSHSAWDGYIEGKILELDPGRRIRQSWRTSEFPQKSADSTLDILFEEVAEGTKITLKHSQIPEGQGESYREGWDDNYFKPLEQYFSGRT
ncbi:MAG: SRPBCC domain-containing protein [Chloroflexi bacterium]|nr:SRPBCC domain-containing protein [Chloroflexota bacterium]